MMDPNLPEWPPTLPQDPFGEKAPDYKAQDATKRTDMDAGPAKVRRRFTARIHDVSVGPMQLTERQLQQLEVFCCVTLGETKPFRWHNFRTGLPAPYRFKAGWSSVVPEFIGTDGTGVRWYNVTADLEMLPG